MLNVLGNAVQLCHLPEGAFPAVDSITQVHSGSAKRFDIAEFAGVNKRLGCIPFQTLLDPLQTLLVAIRLLKFIWHRIFDHWGSLG
jgi:hypothetical protein